jgi:hypothetical protein
VKALVTRSRGAGVAAGCLGLALLASACGGTSPGTGTGTRTGTGPGAIASMMPVSNGIAAKPVAQIVQTADKTLESAASAASVRVYGTLTDSGHRYTLNITFGPNGATGSMTAPFDGAKRASIDLILVGGKMYVRSSTLWGQVGGAAVASLLDNRWVILPSSAMNGFPFANTKAFVKFMNHAGLRKMTAVGAKTTVNGQPAIEVKKGKSAVYIATTGQPYPLEVRQGFRNVLYFQYLPTLVSVTAPPNPVDFSKVKG